MPFYAPVPLGTRFAATHQTLQEQDQTLCAALPEALIQQAAVDAGLPGDTAFGSIYTPAVTLWAFVTQVLSGHKSCVAAVARVVVLLVALGRPPCSAHTGAYCKARAKLSERFLQRLTYTVGTTTEDQAPDRWRWQGRRTLFVDGLELTAADTPAHQKVYPQPKSQKPGLGFPMIRLVVLLTLATASLVGAAWGPHAGKETGETALFRQLLEQLRPGDGVVADRYYCSYWMIALLGLRGVDAAFRLHQRRDYDFRRGKRLGPGDPVVVGTKPACPDWMDAELYASLPDTLTVREVRFAVAQRGYRSTEIIVATTLCDGKRYRKETIADLYHKRWHVELDIRAIKQTLQMEPLSCKTPEMVGRELWVHLLGYNLVRKVMADAAEQTDRSPRQLSFAGAVPTLEAFRYSFFIGSAGNPGKMYRVLLGAIGTHKVGDRPGRCEPRRVKRRPKSYPLLTKPRAEARAELEGQKA